MKRRIGYTLLCTAVVLAGCQTSVKEEKKRAYAEWSQDRAGMYKRLAMEKYHVGDLEGAYKKAAEAYQLNKENLETALLICRIQIDRGNAREAQKELEYLRDKFPRSANVYYYLGVCLERRNQLEDALACYKLAVDLNPKELAYTRAATEVMITLGRLDEARDYLRTRLADADPDAGAEELAGRLAMMQKRYAQAVGHFQQAWSLNGKCLRYQELLAEAHLAAGQYRQTIETLNDLSQNDDYERSLFYYMMLGDAYSATRQFSQAAEQYQQAIRKRPGTITGWIALSRARLAGRDTRRAIQAANQARLLDGSNLDAGLVLGYALLRQKRAREALTVLHALQDHHPKEPMIHALLGKAYSMKGQAKKARQCFRYALWLDPNCKAARALSSRPAAKRS